MISLRRPIQYQGDPYAVGSLGNLCQYFARLIVSPFKQSGELLIVGPRGSGKSYGGLGIAYGIACWVAYYLKKGTWMDYFNPEEDLGIISTENIINVLMRPGKHRVRFGDDLGLAWNSRRFMTGQNISLNSIMEIGRVDRCFSILTIPDGFLIDKVPRSLVPFLGVMEATNPDSFMQHGMVMMKLFRNVRLYREKDRILHPYPTHLRYKYTFYKIPKPPKELVSFYDKCRAEETAKARKAALDDLKPSEPVEPVPSEKALKYQAAMKDALSSNGRKLIDIAADYGFSRAQYAYLSSLVATERRKMRKNES